MLAFVSYDSDIVCIDSPDPRIFDCYNLDVFNFESRGRRILRISISVFPLSLLFVLIILILLSVRFNSVLLSIVFNTRVTTFL